MREKRLQCGPGSCLEHACRLAERGHGVIYYYYCDKRGILDRIDEICGAYPIGLKLERLELGNGVGNNICNNLE